MFFSTLFAIFAGVLAWFGYELRPVETKLKDPVWMRADYEARKQALIKTIAARTADSVLAIGGKKTTNLFRFRKQPKKATRLDVSSFNNVIHVDQEKMIVEVEGMTTYERLVDATLAAGVMPTVVPELKSITIGGAISGIGVESSSYKYGFVHETVLEMEILLCNGTVAVCSREQNSDLFFGMANSYGTLGYVLKVKVKVVPVKKYVQVRHIRFNNMKDYFAAVEEHCKTNRPDFVDGAIFNPTEMYLSLATFCDELPHDVKKPSDYSWMGIYYRSLQNKSVDYLTNKMYIWRWDYDWFWNSKYFHMQHPVLRFLFGRWVLRSTIFMKVFRAFHRSGLYDSKRRELVIQDVEIPIQNCVSFMEFFNKEVGLPNDFYPVWICPVRTYDQSVVYPLYKIHPTDLYVNFGFWDGVAVRDNQPGLINKMIENSVRDLKGKKSLYSSGHYEETEFWQEYNRPAYDALRTKYHATSLLDLYQKCVAAN
ncbi:FAD linked oxidase domain-containing protein [Capsaspora owczarzaki ATCC 30864]|uniref:Delta(24)-sterol reductase n=1 Tax=Capsaspora owczarzaki (strain ATCC 30864) TaxID=595528 RepID=A0A0D2UEV2_CAPO3|nr:FAD linked oxidase domain-containing protein [Capsaspora owczarzaki ATCC 30864]KJE93601.1 FAD linked oxidase domain-containing protein [Capsaspora owczarzaki ATCC 30864]|eukprot:XP_004348191.2 FAD linked oxidase domain-containing protein [Capsaspora owczarzaki ATCC 30864]